MEKSTRRRSERLLISIPIRVHGSDAEGRKFTEESRTLIINRHGARIPLQRPVVPGAVLRIVNLMGRKEADFRVVGATQPVTDKGGEWGIECRDEKTNIWGIEFPPPAEEDGTVGSALIECRRCHAKALTHLSFVELDVLSTSGLLAMECKACGQATTWGYVLPESPLGEVGAASPDAEGGEPRPSGINRRKHARAALKLPARLRSFSGVVEIAKSQNVAKGGFCFISEKEYEIGEIVFVTCPYDPRGQNIEVRGRVVRRQRMQGTSSSIYGLSYEHAE